ncbi:Uncharacterized protein HZ326_17524 [Fusarium oxysporum f. sp. albedinis]|nr:Uncharacterized protein HZ326_17524 [Fusarium oxysporum f. sp. albedinis]
MSHCSTISLISNIHKPSGAVHLRVGACRLARSLRRAAVRPAALGRGEGRWRSSINRCGTLALTPTGHWCPRCDA